MKNITPEQLYIRQTTLSEIGEKGQQQLLQANVVIVGCGGLGNVAASYLAGSGIGAIHLVDYDVVDASNLHRQVFYTTKDIGKPKAEVLSKHLISIAPFSKVTTFDKAASKETINEIIDKGDIILDCTDSLPVKYLLNDACVLSDKALIYGSLYKYDGYVSSFNVKQEEGNFSANLRDAFPEISKEAVPNCSEAGTLNSIVGIIGLMQANEVLKLVTGVGKPLTNALLIYNSLENTQFKMKLKRSFTKEKIQQLFERETYVDATCEFQDKNLLISSKELKKELSLRAQSRSLGIISVIENTITPLPFEVEAKIPLSKFDDLMTHIERSRNIDQDKSFVIVCNKGISSYTATLRLKEKYPKLNVLSLEKGITNY